MRLWSLHPSLLDRAALVACWREALLAQAVLAGRTRGYARHPQLDRFRESRDPLAAIGTYLRGLADEADVRGYRFDRGRISSSELTAPLVVTDGQLAFELDHLSAKVRARSPEWLTRLSATSSDGPRPHPLFVVRSGGMASWEKT